MKKYPLQQIIRQLRSFMGLVGFYTKFVLNFDVIESLLYQLMKNTTKFQWTTECQNALKELKTALVSVPILGFLIKNDRFVLCTEASLTGLGAVLSQKQRNGEKVIAYASKAQKRV